MNIIAREIEFSPSEPTQIYHAVDQSDYLAIVARTPDGRFPIVRQYRPALESFTWELPAGLAEPGEDLAEGCRRELLEETGYPTRAIHALGTAAPCSGRLSNRIHSFFLETGERIADFMPEPGLTVELATPSELVAHDQIRRIHSTTASRRAAACGAAVLHHAEIIAATIFDRVLMPIRLCRNGPTLSRHSGELL